MQICLLVHASFSLETYLHRQICLPHNKTKTAQTNKNGQVTVEEVGKKVDQWNRKQKERISNRYYRTFLERKRAECERERENERERQKTHVHNYFSFRFIYILLSFFNLQFLSMICILLHTSANLFCLKTSQSLTIIYDAFFNGTPSVQIQADGEKNDYVESVLCAVLWTASIFRQRALVCVCATSIGIYN